MGPIERVAWRHTLPRVNWTASGKLPSSRGVQSAAPWSSGGWDGMGRGMDVREGGDDAVRQRPAQRWKAIILQINFKCELNSN